MPRPFNGLTLNRTLPHAFKLETQTSHFLLSQILVEPGDGLIETVGLVFGFNEEMPFAGIDDELGRHAQRLERVPEFIGLRRGAFGIALPDNDERRRLDVFDEMNRRTFLVSGSV